MTEQNHTDAGIEIKQQLFFIGGEGAELMQNNGHQRDNGQHHHQQFKGAGRNKTYRG